MALGLPGIGSVVAAAAVELSGTGEVVAASGTSPLPIPFPLPTSRSAVSVVVLAVVAEVAVADVALVALVNVAVLTAASPAVQDLTLAHDMPNATSVTRCALVVHGQLPRGPSCGPSLRSRHPVECPRNV